MISFLCSLQHFSEQEEQQFQDVNLLMERNFGIEVVGLGAVSMKAALLTAGMDNGQGTRVQSVHTFVSYKIEATLCCYLL